jgi:hypothetical protein
MRMLPCKEPGRCVAHTGRWNRSLKSLLNASYLLIIEKRFPPPTTPRRGYLERFGVRLTRVGGTLVPQLSTSVGPHGVDSSMYGAAHHGLPGRISMGQVLKRTGLSMRWVCL